MRAVVIPDGDTARAVAMVLERGLAMIERSDAVRPLDVLYAIRVVDVRGVILAFVFSLARDHRNY